MSILNKILNRIDLSLKDASVFLLTILLFMYSCYPFGLLSIVLFVFTILVLILNFSNIKKRYNKKEVLIFFVFISWLFILCSTILYSENKEYGLKLIQRFFNIIIIAFTFIFIFPYRILKGRNILYLAFILSNITFTMMIYYKAINVVEVSCYPQIYYKSYLEKIIFILEKPNNIIFSCFENEHKHSFFIHRVYNSMSFLFSIILTIEILFSKVFKKNYMCIFLGVCVIFWFLFLIYYQFSVVNVFLTFILVPSFLILKIKLDNKVDLGYKKVITIGLVILALFFSIIKLNSSSVAIKQLSPAINFFEKVITSEAINNVDERYEINKASKSLIIEKPLFGYGVGDVQDKLDEFYKKNMNKSVVYKKAYDNGLNSHNNYAFFTIAGGVFVLLLFIFSQLFLLRISFLEKNLVYMFFIIIFSFNIIFENMLSRIHGIIFYTLFNSLFITQYLYRKKC